MTNVTSCVGYQISNFFLKDWRRTNLWVVKSVGSSSLMVPPRLPVSRKLISNWKVWNTDRLTFFFFYFRVAKRVGSAVINETS